MSRRRRWVIALALMWWLPVAVASATDEGHRRIPKTDRVVEEAANAQTGNTRVIVSFKPGLRREWARALRSDGFVVRGEHAVVESLTIDLPDSDLERVALAPAATLWSTRFKRCRTVA